MPLKTTKSSNANLNNSFKIKKGLVFVQRWQALLLSYLSDSGLLLQMVAVGLHRGDLISPPSRRSGINMMRQKTLRQTESSEETAKYLCKGVPRSVCKGKGCSHQ